jgi:hypothetical protein
LAIASTAARASLRAVPVSPVDTRRGNAAIAAAFDFNSSITVSISFRA